MNQPLPYIFVSFLLTCYLSVNGQTTDRVTYIDDRSECDSLKFPDFKTNVQEIEIRVTSGFKEEIESIARDFIDVQCKRDSSYCRNIYLKDEKFYRSPSGLDLFSFAYILGDSIGMEKESASFFVFGIKNKSKIIFYDIAEELDGEIQLSLNGLEKINGLTIIWGEMYPYFSGNYGMFKLTIVGQETNYEFECKEREYGK